ncbi:MAG: hypothetical protein M3537_04425 [Chloroflexota bacterium]|nr:hypothetical protein [Chloroflexota bacterium]
MSTRILVRAGVAALAAIGMVAAAPAAYAGGPTTTVTHQHGVTESFIDTGATCSDDLYEITVTYNGVLKESIFDDGRAHATFTQTGTFTVTPIDAGQAGSGHFTIWGGFNANGKTVNGTFTFNATGTNADGTRISTHGVDHFNVRPDGVENAFSLCRD